MVKEYFGRFPYMSKCNCDIIIKLGSSVACDSAISDSGGIPNGEKVYMSYQKLRELMKLWSRLGLYNYNPSTNFDAFINTNKIFCRETIFLFVLHSTVNSIIYLLFHRK